ncbi:MAG: hypothetical protein K8I00_05710 [Candidatus Omnitrophica bacterium]|nr:hypothetical protein [Candidatus Omnitrophota bacterium]
MKKNVLGIMLVLLLAGTTMVYAEGMNGDMAVKGMMKDMGNDNDEQVPVKDADHSSHH